MSRTDIRILHKVLDHTRVEIRHMSIAWPSHSSFRRVLLHSDNLSIVEHLVKGGIKPRAGDNRHTHTFSGAAAVPLAMSLVLET
jgi:hypothetical protein